MDDRQRAALGLAAFATAILIAAVLLGAYMLSRRLDPGSEERAAALRQPEVATGESPWLNTTREAEYIGTDNCAACHEAEHGSYLTTAHSKSLSRVRLDQEPPDGEYFHEPSGRHYQIYRKDGEMRHREYLVDEDDQTVAETDLAVDWLIGSGRHSRSYLIERDGFLFESPITWYEREQRRGMSPGYDGSSHWGFERPASRGCLYCHVGDTSPRRDGYQKLKVLEAAISCERCHGPGSLHAARHESGQTPVDIDHTIVNPRHLDRELQEDICAQCHLRGVATVLVEAKDLTDYRPGLPLADFRVDFRTRKASTQMKVVGHVEQMRLSRCYQNSARMTCTTCHDPHHDDTRPADYQQACLQCHDSAACGLDEPQRMQRADNQCVQCHMPQSPTDIPHLAFTHHRIGIHAAGEASGGDLSATDESAGNKAADDVAGQEGGRPAELIPWKSLRRLSQWQQHRLHGLAYFEFANSQPTAEAAKLYRSLAQDQLESLLDQREPDSEIDAALARLVWQRSAETATHAATHALQDPNISDSTRVNMLYLISDNYLRQGDTEIALSLLNELMQLRMHSEDYLLQGLCHLKDGDLDKAIASLETAQRINPFSGETHLVFADVYRAKNDDAKVRYHLEMAEKLGKTPPPLAPTPAPPTQ